MNKLHVSKENSKMGKVTSVSLTPVVSCPPNVPCSKICYAMGSYRLRQNVRTAWDDNYNFWASDPIGFFTAIDKYLASTKRPIKFFRWHVGGDIPSQRYLNSMCGIARDFDNIKFLAFTKNHLLDFSLIPDNLTIIASMWVKWGNANVPLRKAWYQDGTETRIPSNALECHGNCETCGLCWNLPSIGRDVVFYKH